jgi:hypothetical protein
MAKYTVEGFIRVKVTVEADSEDEAIEMAEESFDLETHCPTDALPEWQVANELEPIEEDEDEDYNFKPSRGRLYDDEEEDYD